MKLQQKYRPPGLKAKVASMAIRGESTLRQLAVQWKVNQSQVWSWKKRLLERASLVFQGRDPPGGKPHGLEVSRRRQNELWMLNVLLGKISLVQLVKELAILPRDHVERLYDCVKNNTFRYRARALAMLAHNKGVRIVTIRHFLTVGQNYVSRIESAYQAHGIDWFSKHAHQGLRRYEQEPYKKAAFAILHSPPSAHGINRTTWTIKLIWEVMSKQGMLIGKTNLGKIIRNAGYRYCKAKNFLTSNDPDYREKVEHITNILSKLKSDEKFFSVDEFGPFAVKMQGGRSYMKRGEVKVVPIIQKSKGTLIVTAALELSENQVVHFYSEHKNTSEMLKLLEILLIKYAGQFCLYFSWDAASWHASKKLYRRVDEINSSEYRAHHSCPRVKLAPLPSRAQFLNVIESVFSGMACAIIHNSDYQSVGQAMAAIDRYFAERNQEFRDNPRRAGGKIWGKELVAANFNEANNCKNKRYSNSR